MTRSLLVTLILFSTLQPITATQSIQDETEILKILEQRIAADQKGVAIAVGIINEKGTTLVNFGRMKVNEGRGVDANSLFEIGSITKVFTCTLLADMVLRGEMKLDDPISMY